MSGETQQPEREPVTPVTGGIANSMRAAVIEAPRDVVVRRVPVPEPGEGEVLVRLEGCGVCVSNLPEYEGREWFDYPRDAGAPGHEGWGYVEAVGPGVDGLSPGMRVATLSYKAYAEYDLAPRRQVMPLPRELDGLPFPAEPLGCAMNVFQRSEIDKGQTVAVIGIGFLGALLVQMAARVGADVIALGRREWTLDFARELGAKDTLLLDDHYAIIEKVKERTGGKFCDVVIEATGASWPLDLAGELTAERGRLVVAGFHQDGPRQINMQLWNWRGIDVVNAHERDPGRYMSGMAQAAKNAAAGDLGYMDLLTHKFGLEGLGECFGMMAERPEGFLKGYIKF